MKVRFLTCLLVFFSCYSRAQEDPIQQAKVAWGVKNFPLAIELASSIKPDSLGENDVNFLTHALYLALNQGNRDSVLKIVATIRAQGKKVATDNNSSLSKLHQFVAYHSNEELIEYWDHADENWNSFWTQFSVNLKSKPTDEFLTSLATVEEAKALLEYRGSDTAQVCQSMALSAELLRWSPMYMNSAGQIGESQSNCPFLLLDRPAFIDGYVQFVGNLPKGCGLREFGIATAATFSYRGPLQKEKRALKWLNKFFDEASTARLSNNDDQDKYCARQALLLSESGIDNVDAKIADYVIALLNVNLDNDRLRSDVLVRTLDLCIRSQLPLKGKQIINQELSHGLISKELSFFVQSYDTVFNRLEVDMPKSSRKWHQIKLQNLVIPLHKSPQPVDLTYPRHSYENITHCTAFEVKGKSYYMTVSSVDFITDPGIEAYLKISPLRTTRKFVSLEIDENNSKFDSSRTQPNHVRHQSGVLTSGKNQFKVLETIFQREASYLHIQTIDFGVGGGDFHYMTVNEIQSAD